MVLYIKVSSGRQDVDLSIDTTVIGVRNLMLKLNTSEKPPGKVRASMKLFGENVLPLFG